MPRLRPTTFSGSPRWQRRNRRCRTAAPLPLLLFSLVFPAAPALAAAENGPPDFTRQIHPLLTENCFKCHGPDDAARKSGLRFDVRIEALKAAKSGHVAIVPGAPEKSELIARITAADPQKHMPPPDSGKKLSAAQIELLRRWIAGGAPYAKHWSYIKPVRPPLPEVNHRDWPRDPIDRFILARLERERLDPSPEAPPAVLIRRVSLALTGLPPSPEAVAAFVKDPSPAAYAAAVDRLLQDRAFGEHWARMWLDLARYADSAGYADDPLRTIWAFRDYVIRSFNKNKPFDRFTLEQIAGDLLPDATEEDKIASAFHRNTMTNNEGGTDDEEFRNAAIVDRVNTTLAVWMGTSMACAQCHHHKYDPLSQQEYFRLFAIFNNTADADRPDEAPVLEFYTKEQEKQRAAWKAEQTGIEKQFKTPDAALDAEQSQWERDLPLELFWQSARGCSERPLWNEDKFIKYTATPEPVLGILALSPQKRNDAQREQLTAYYRAHIAPELKPQRERLAELDRLLAKPGYTVPVMQELEGAKRRATHVEIRGNFRQLGEPVTEGVPAVFPPLPAGPPNRLALARWLVDEDNPLTARVIANRFWEQIFGTGIVRTSDDFGSQGDLPTHPELLDWLATELAAQHWDIKAFLKLLVTSATFRQSSRVTPELLERDPDNLLLARGPRFRMPAEEVRDQALFVSGLLSRKMFGPPVRPPRPALGLSAAFGSSLDWKDSTGEDRYRRAIYIEWRRTSPYPSLSTFDAPNREVCALRRPRSNTPLQALVTLNDPVFVEAAQGLGRRMAAQPGPAEAKVDYGFRLCLAHTPNPDQSDKLVSFYQATRADFSAKPEAAKKMATEPLGESPPGADMADLAAWTAVGNVLLNLDETLMPP